MVKKIQIEIFNCQISPGLTQLVNRVASTTEYYSHVMKKHLNKELVMTKKDYDNLEGFTKCWICGNSYIDGNVTKREHCRITGTYKGSALILILF